MLRLTWAICKLNIFAELNVAIFGLKAVSNDSANHALYNFFINDQNVTECSVLMKQYVYDLSSSDQKASSEEAVSNLISNYQFWIL